MRRPETESNISMPKFMAWLCSRWRSSVVLVELLSPMYNQRELAGLSYYQRVQKVYGFDIDSQFKAIPRIEEAVSAWSNANKKRQVADDVKQTPSETLCIGYIKSRFEIGASFILRADLMQSAMTRVEEVSKVTCNAIVDAAYAPRCRPAELTKDDVFFTVVDPTPESKKLHRDLTQARVISQVVIRVHGVDVVGSALSVSPNGILRRIDVRPWCSSPAQWQDLAMGLLRCDEVVESTHYGVARQQCLPDRGITPRQLVAPDACEILALAFSGAEVSDHQVLDELARSGNEEGDRKSVV